jgi:hypothetical protein
MCKHIKLEFGSGDYYLFCKTCDNKWVLTELCSDKADPSRANPNFEDEYLKHEDT